ncbi:hypothetical protein M4D79_25520 [Mycolicibacterium novocastrense]|nr:hypothetical protein M4D79_25520 [Mycolicibacterium novocastrense]
MARFADHDAAVGADLYAELLNTEEDKFARLGGRRVLVRDEMVIIDDPGPVLAALRAGKPVEIPDWQLPRWARRAAQNHRVTVHPDCRVVQVK